MFDLGVGVRFDYGGGRLRSSLAAGATLLAVPGDVDTAGTIGAFVDVRAATERQFKAAFEHAPIANPLVATDGRLISDGVNVASLALMAVVTAQLGRAAIVDMPEALIGCDSP